MLITEGLQTKYVQITQGHPVDNSRRLFNARMMEESLFRDSKNLLNI